jgi:hypothetical protein
MAQRKPWTRDQKISIGGTVAVLAAALITSLWKHGATDSAQPTIVGSYNSQTTVVGSNNTFSASTPAPAAARIVVSKFNLFQEAGKPYYGWNIYMANRGGLPGYAPEITMATRLTPAAPGPEETDEGMSKTRALALKVPPRHEQQMEIGQEQFAPVHKRLVPEADMQAVKSGEKHFYLWVALAFLDDSVAPGKFWISEYCGELQPDLNTIRICGQKTAISE